MLLPHLELELMTHYLFTSESVSVGHPDKVADQISDAVLDACLKGDPFSRVACETVVASGLVFLAGEITTSASLDYLGHCTADASRDRLRRCGVGL